MLLLKYTKNNCLTLGQLSLHFPPVEEHIAPPRKELVSSILFQKEKKNKYDQRFIQPGGSLDVLGWKLSHVVFRTVS